MLSAEQCQQFESQGYVLAQPLSPAELTDAQETWHRLVQNEVGYAERADDAGYIRLISHPFFEGVAKQLLRSSSVHLAEMSVKELAPGERTGHGWESGCHLDWQITTADWNATPRRDLLAIWLWVEDVTPEMGAMRILPSVSLSPSLHVSLSRAPSTNPFPAAASAAPTADRWLVSVRQRIAPADQRALGAGAYP